MADEVVVPFAFNGKRNGNATFELPAGGEERLIQLLEAGLDAASPEQQVQFLKSKRPPRRTKRGVVRLHLPHELFKAWQKRKAEVQKVSNRRIADRLSVVALALAFAQLSATIPSSVERGFVSFQGMRRAASSETYDNGVVSLAAPKSKEIRVQALKSPLPEKPSRPPNVLTARSLSREEATRVFGPKVEPVLPSSKATPGELRQELLDLGDEIDRYLQRKLKV